MNFYTYPQSKELKNDYREVRDFLIQSQDTEYCYARWDWMISHTMTKAKDLSKIGIWKEKIKL
ncbi:MAG: hypothetical protein AB7E09_01010 [Candidatus Izemoplasmatales bacterium]